MNTVQYRNIKEIKEDPKNPRTIDGDELAALSVSIKDNPELFEARPIILSDRTGELIIIGGSKRYQASKLLGLKKVPTILIPKLTELKEREIMIRDNVNNGEWDIEALKEWDQENLLDWGLNLSFGEDEAGPAQTKELEPYKRVHCLISFPPESLIDLEPLLDQIKNIPGIEYEQSAN